jgi:hypothetical protein
MFFEEGGNMRATRWIGMFLLIAWTVPGKAAVKTEEKTQFHMEGMLGRMMSLFGGKAAKEGVTEKVAVKGNRKMTLSEENQTGQIIDLDEEKVYDLDLKGKSYKVTTFDEMRRRMQEARDRASKEVAKSPDQSAQAPPPPPDAQQMQVDFEVKETGQKKDINGYSCREVVMTISVHQKGQKIEDSGGIVLASNMWLTPRIDSMKEIQEFDRRYAEKLAGPLGSSAGMPSADQMAAAYAMYPYLKDAVGKMDVENVNMDGTAIVTTATFQGVQSAEQAAQQQKASAKQDSGSDVGAAGGLLGGKKSIGGVLGGIGARAVQKKLEQKTEQSAQSDQTPGRTNIMTSTVEILKVSTDVTDADVALPAGFKLRK